MIIAIKHQTLELRRFETEGEAMSAGNGHMLISDEASLARTVLTSEQLRDIHNSVIPATENPVDHFYDRVSAVDLTFAALQKHFDSATTENSNSVTEENDMPQSTTTKPKKKASKPKTVKEPKAVKPVKESTVKKIAKATAKVVKKAAKATAKVAKKAAKPKPAWTKPIKKVKKAPKEKKAPRDFLITPTKGNPFREGSKSYKDFQKVVDKPGRSFKEYVKTFRVYPGTIYRALKLGRAKKTKAI